MADLDAELLALAGDSSDDDAPKQENQEGVSAGERDGSPDDDTDRIATVPRKVKRAPPRRAARRDQSDEDGEASSVSNEDSVPMDESDDERRSPSDDKSGPLFPVDGKFYSEKDKAEVLAKPEVDREAILAERAGIIERRQQDSVLRRIYENRQEGSQMAGKKRSAEAASLDAGERKSTRQRKNLAGQKIGETSSSLEAYKEQRARRGERKAAPAESRRLRRSASGSDLDAEGESEVEWDTGKPRQEAGSQYEEPAELDDFNRVRVGRFQFAQYCFYPTFEAAVKDCYVRVALAPEKGNTEMTYRMAKIEAIKQDGAPYALENDRQRPFKCTKYVIASIGKSRREWPFIFCSTGRISEREFARYKGAVVSEQLSLPKKSFLSAKIKDINNMINYNFTDQELNKKLKDSGVLEEREKQKEKVILIGKRNDAEREGNKELMHQIQEQIRELEGPDKLAFNTSLYKPAAQKTGKSEGERLAEINRANRKANTENVRRAQIAERKAAAEHRARVERGEAVADPFARVKIRPKTHFDANTAGGAATAAAKSHMSEAEIARRIAEEKAKEDASQAKRPVSEALAKLMSGEVEVQPGKIDFAKYDIMYQFGKLSQKKKPGHPSIFQRKLFDHEILGTYDMGIKVPDMDSI